MLKESFAAVTNGGEFPAFVPMKEIGVPERLVLALCTLEALRAHK
jgi:hypothetical protein